MAEEVPELPLYHAGERAASGMTGIMPMKVADGEFSRQDDCSLSGQVYPHQGVCRHEGSLEMADMG